jgi:hypothetical protein
MHLIANIQLWSRLMYHSASSPLDNINCWYFCLLPLTFAILVCEWVAGVLSVYLSYQGFSVLPARARLFILKRTPDRRTTQ